jgi:hypothetical protein
VTAYTFVPDGSGGLKPVAQMQAKVLRRPDGTPTSVRIDANGSPVLTPDAAGNPDASAAEWFAVQNKVPGPLPTPERLLQQQAVADQLAAHDAGPATAADRFLGDLQSIGAAHNAKVDIPDPPRTLAERDERVIAARTLAARLGYDLRTVPRFSSKPFTTLTGQPGVSGEILALVDCFGQVYSLGPLPDIESRLTIDARERAVRDRAEAAVQEANAKRARVQAEAVANSPAAQLAALRAELDALKAERV